MSPRPDDLIAIVSTIALVELMRCERARDRRASEYSRQMSRSTQFTRLSRVSQDITMATDIKDGVLKRKKIDNGLESVPEAEVTHIPE